MSSHTDNDYLPRLKNLVTTIVTSATKSKSPSIESVQILAHPYRRQLSFWQQPELRTVDAVGFASFLRPGYRDPEGHEAPYPDEVIDAGYLRLKEAGQPTVLISADHMGKKLDSVYRELSIEAYLNHVNIRVKWRNETLANEAAVWRAFSALLSPDDPFFEKSYVWVVRYFEQREHRHQRQRQSALGKRKPSRSSK